MSVTVSVFDDEKPVSDSVVPGETATDDPGHATGAPPPTTEMVPVGWSVVPLMSTDPPGCDDDDPFDDFASQTCVSVQVTTTPAGTNSFEALDGPLVWGGLVTVEAVAVHL